jgi:hypothetical protein
MSQEDDYSIGYALLCVQRSLLDAVTENLRAVVIDLYETRLCLSLDFYYDGAVPEQDIERWSCAIPFTGPSKNGGYLAFLRWEPGETKVDPANVFRIHQEKKIADVPEAYALLAANNALLGKVSPELRAVTVAVPSDSKLLRVCFFYDGEARAEMLQLWEKAASEMCTRMGNEYSCDTQITRVDFPQKITIPQGRIAYFRKE